MKTLLKNIEDFEKILGKSKTGECSDALQEKGLEGPGNINGGLSFKQLKVSHTFSEFRKDAYENPKRTGEKIKPVFRISELLVVVNEAVPFFRKKVSYLKRILGDQWPKEGQSLCAERHNLFSDQLSDQLNLLAEEPIAPELEDEHSVLLKTECFLTVNRRNNQLFFTTQEVLWRTLQMLEALKAIKEQPGQAKISPDTEIPADSEISCHNKISLIFSKEFLKSEQHLIILSEIYRLFRLRPFPNISIKEGERELGRVLYKNLTLIIYGIRLPQVHAEDYKLHEAVFENNLPQIRRICAREHLSGVFFYDVNQVDLLGITPLMLAVKLGKSDAALILSDHGADPDLRPLPFVNTPLEEAITMKSRNLLSNLLIAKHRQKQIKWETSKDRIVKVLERIPNFTIEMKWDCDSNLIPFVKKIAPSDNYKIHKLGSSVRIDTTLAGYSNLKCERANRSLVFKGKEFLGQGGSHEIGSLFVYDFENKRKLNVMADLSPLQLESIIDNHLKNEHLEHEIQTGTIQLSQCKSWLGEEVKQKFGLWQAQKYTAKGNISLTLVKKQYLSHVEIKKFPDFQSYFQFSLANPIMQAVPEKPNQSPYDILVAKMKRMGTEKSNNTKTSTLYNPALDDLKIRKTFKKNICASVWLAPNFPINMDSFIPILEILALFSKQVERVKNFLIEKSILETNYFIIKANVPLFYTVSANLLFKEFSFKVPEDIFNPFFSDDFCKRPVILVEEKKLSASSKPPGHSNFKMADTDTESEVEAQENFHKLLKKHKESQVLTTEFNDVFAEERPGNKLKTFDLDEMEEINNDSHVISDESSENSIGRLIHNFDTRSCRVHLPGSRNDLSDRWRKDLRNNEENLDFSEIRMEEDKFHERNFRAGYDYRKNKKHPSGRIINESLEPIYFSGSYMNIRKKSEKSMSMKSFDCENTSPNKGDTTFSNYEIAFEKHNIEEDIKSYVCSNPKSLDSLKKKHERYRSLGACNFFQGKEDVPVNFQNMKDDFYRKIPKSKQQSPKK